MRCAYHSTGRITLQAHIMVCAHFILCFNFQELDDFAFFAHFTIQCAFHSAYHFRCALHSPFLFSGLRIFLIQCAYHCRCTYCCVRTYHSPHTLCKKLKIFLSFILTDAVGSLKQMREQEQGWIY